MDRHTQNKLEKILLDYHDEIQEIKESSGAGFDPYDLEIPLHRAVDEIDNLINTRELQTVIEVLMDLLLKMNKSERANENI